MNWEKIDRKVFVAGLVTDKEIQMPIAGARVVIDGPRQDRTESRGDGSYFFLDLPDGDYSLKVTAPGLGTRYGTETKSVKLPSEESKRLNTDLQLQPTCITGKVTDTENGAIGSASIRLRADANVTLTDADGRFMLGPLVASQPTIRVSAPDYITQDVPLLKKLEPGKEKKVTIKLKTDSQE